MATVYCDNCGTSLFEETAKFCRACGKATPLSEATTKRFDEPRVVQNQTNPVGASFTAPAYMAPLEMPAQPTNDLRQKKQKRNLIILVSMMAVMIFALVGLLAFLSFDQGPPEGPPPEVPTFGSRPSGSGVPGVPAPAPPVPPLPPLAPDASRPTIDPSLIYPGARETMSVEGEGGKRVIQLQSDDPAARVSNWYISKLKVTKKVVIGGQTILKAGNLGVIIFGNEEGARIMITSGDEN